MHVGRQHLHAQLFRIVDVLHHDVALIAVLDLAGEKGGHELGRVVRLQVGGLVADEGIGGGMGFVEAVAAEEGDQVEDFPRGLLGHAPLLGAHEKFRPPLVDDFVLFFADGLDASIGT